MTSSLRRLGVADLAGDDLDMAVALADRHEVRRSTMEFAQGIHERWPGGNWEWIRRPSRCWEHAGPIIERELIDIVHVPNSTSSTWRAASGHVRGTGRHFIGSTPLIAAMRAYVSSKFGDSVELP